MLQAFTPPTNTDAHEVATMDDQLFSFLVTPDLAPDHTPLCRYAGKPCTNPRAMKRNGSLHSLCGRHRMRANNNQRRMTRRRRANEARMRVTLQPYLGRLSVDVSASWAASSFYAYDPSAYSAALTPGAYESKSLFSTMFADPRTLDAFSGTTQPDLIEYASMTTPGLDESYFMDVSRWLEPAPAMSLEAEALTCQETDARIEQQQWQFTETVDLSAYIAPPHVHTGYHHFRHNYQQQQRQYEVQQAQQ